MEVCSLLPLITSQTPNKTKVIVDIHLPNVLVKLPSNFDQLSIDQFREKFSEPEMIPISRVDRKPLPPNIPSQAVVPLYLGKKAQEFTLADARGPFSQ